MATYDNHLSLKIDGARRLDIPTPDATLQVSILPKRRIARNMRRCWSREAKRIVTFLDDSPEFGGARGPAAFDDIAIKWAARSADYIAVWECGDDLHIVARLETMLARHDVSALVLTNRGWARAWYQALSPLAKRGCNWDMLVIREGR